MKSIVFDLDDTICFPNHKAKDTHTKYALALPNMPMIKAIEQMVISAECRQEEIKIIISSARRMLTHDGDLEAIHADVYDVTVKWLTDYGVPYDELQFGKPYASTYYVDDKSLRPEEFIDMYGNDLPQKERKLGDWSS